jgi:HlyD family secretion protein
LENAQQVLEDARSVDKGETTREEQIAVSQAQVDQAQAGVDQAQAALQALTKGASESELAAVQAAVDAAVAQVNQVKSQIALQTLVAPIDGWILEHLALPGEVVLPGWPVVTLADLSELELVVYVPEMDLKWIRVGDPAKIRVDAYPDKTFSGQVVRIADQAEYTPRNVQTPKERVILVYAVHLRVPNPDGILKPGLPADATFEVQP